MAEKRWEFRVDGIGHIVELQHGYFSGRRSIRVDGRELAMSLGEGSQVVDSGSRHAFSLGDHLGEAVIHNRGLYFEYDLLVDGVSVTPGQPSAAHAKRRELVSLFLLIGIGGICINWLLARTMGWFYDELAAIAAACMVLGLYFLLFPKRFEAHYAGRSNAFLMVLLLLALAIGLLNVYALEHGWY